MIKKTSRFIFFIAIVICMMIISACKEDSAPGEDSAPMPVKATVIGIEKYGHAILDITVSEFNSKGYDFGDVVCVKHRLFELDMPYFDEFYSNPGEVMLLGETVDSNVTMCINYYNFSQKYSVEVGDIVELLMAEKAGQLEVQNLLRLKYTNNREDYESDAVFANFRTVTGGRISEGKLYRSASPVNNEYGRASYANALIEAAGVATILNLSDSDEMIKSFFDMQDFSSDYYRSLYENGQVCSVALKSDFYSTEFALLTAQGIVFLSEKEPPYIIHCKEGKDRTGFVCMILESLMGATLDEVISDYMLSFYNYYGVSKSDDARRYQLVLEKNILPMMYYVTGTDTLDALKQVDLEVAATKYLLSVGVTEGEISMLKNKLEE